MNNKETGGPAFPFGQVSEVSGQVINGYHNDGMTLRQYAAIKLKVPDSGTDWLDEMIQQSLRNDFAAQVLVGLSIRREGKSDQDDSRNAYSLADAMLEARKS